jgi:hypothetical protein
MGLERGGCSSTGDESLLVFAVVGLRGWAIPRGPTRNANFYMCKAFQTDFVLLKVLWAPVGPQICDIWPDRLEQIKPSHLYLTERLLSTETVTQEHKP